MGLFTRISRKHKNKNYYSLKESGNVFLMLFGAVGMVGVIGASTMTVMKGPVRTMAQVTKQTLTENEMIAAGKLALISATQNGGDCDTDGVVEPIEMSTITIPGFSGGSEIPATIGTSKEDSWGMRYGYCSWDHGTAVDTDGCSGNRRLAGTDSGDQYVIAIVSAGPDGVFQTACNDYVDADATPGPDVALVEKQGGSDDIFLGYTYSEAAAASGGLWNEVDADTASIARDVTIQDSGGVDQFAFEATSGNLQIGGSGQFPITQTDNLRSYDGVGGTINVESALSSDSAIATSSNISGANITASGALDVTGTSTLGALNAGATGVSSLTASGLVSGGSLSTGGTLNAGASTLGATGVTSLSASGLINTTGNATFGDDISDTVGIAGDTTIGGILGVTGTATFGRINMTDSLRIQRDTSSGPDIGFHASGLIEADNDLFLNIDSNNNETTRALIVQKDSDTSAGTELFRINESGLVTVQGKITNLSTPTADTDAATKKYVDDQITTGMSGFSEADPQVGNLGTGTPGDNWCTSDGTEINCTASTPSTSGSSINELSDAKSDTASSVFLGANSGANDDGNNFVTAVGINALERNTSGNSNTAIGSQAALGNTTGNSNTAVGRAALRLNSTGISNTAVGSLALQPNTGSNNTAVGSSSLGANTTGGTNTAVGSSSLGANTTGRDNVAVGSSSLGDNIAGRRNVAIGRSALGGASVTSDNVAIGHQAGISSDNVTGNVLIGTQTGGTMSTGANNNIYIGYRSGYLSTTSGANNIMLGSSALPSSPTASNELNIGNILFGSGVGTTAGSKVGAVEYCDENLTNCFSAGSVSGGSADNLGDHTATQGLVFFKVTGAAAPTK